jgi:hypothetical protein
MNTSGSEKDGDADTRRENPGAVHHAEKQFVMQKLGGVQYNETAPSRHADEKEKMVLQHRHVGWRSGRDAQHKAFDSETFCMHLGPATRHDTIVQHEVPK